MKTRLTCPCGTTVVGKDEDELVTLTQEHLAAEHPGFGNPAAFNSSIAESCWMSFTVTAARFASDSSTGICRP